MNPKFDTIPPRTDPEYVRPPDSAYDSGADLDYRRNQAVDHIITKRLIDRITGSGDAEGILYGINPSDQYFGGALASQYRYKRAQHEGDSYESIATKVAPFSTGLKFKLKPDTLENLSLKVEPSALIFYQRFPTFAEQVDRGKLAGQGEDEMETGTGEDQIRADGGDTIQETQRLLSVYNRVDPDLDSVSIDGEDILETTSSSDVWTHDLSPGLEDAREAFRADNRAMRLPYEDLGRRDYEDVQPEALVDEGAFETHLNQTFGEERVPTYWAAELQLRAQKQEDGMIAVTISLVNTYGSDYPDCPGVDERPESWQSYLFDAGLEISGPLDAFAPFESEEIRDEYQYDGRIFASGENCAVKRSIQEGKLTIQTDAVPTYQQPKYHSRESVDAPFAELADGEIDDVLESIESEMERAYEQYREIEGDILAGKSEEAAKRYAEALEDFEEERERFKNGRQLIASNPDIERSFRAMNRAFDRLGFEQWRLFQIIYIVMSIPDIAAQANPESDIPHHLDTGDVIYFPTGGGKTEAYLGLVVFTAFHDRLRGKDYGTTAWTKFPLRLLSLQQLQRIANVLGQAELIRREEDFGGDEFSVGYFVGNRNTPNKVIEERDGQVINNPERARDQAQYKEQWLTITECPFCGEEEVELDGDVDELRIVHKCTNPDCSEVARQGGEEAVLPVYITDEEIYRYAPTFVVSTIDKIAIVGMQRRVRTLFGQMTHRCPEHGFTAEAGCLATGYHYPDDMECDIEELEDVEKTDPPSILIQDELHLLREEFGTFDSHYETFLQEWMRRCTEGEWNMKVVAATATIAGAEDQVRSLYWKDASVYPSQGPRLRQSFYAYEDPHELGRRMVGVTPRSVSRTYAIDHIIKERARIVQEFESDYEAFEAALLDDDDEELPGPLELPEDQETRQHLLKDLIDQYEVQISYNIAKKSSDLVLRTVKTMVNRQLEARGDPYRPLNAVSLTGETRMQDVRDALTRLETKNAEDPIDLVVATSMISHGVDVDRFNFISFFGMPRNTAEYIQAYSRVGRHTTGSVLVLFNPMLARDRSHYTQFQHYHRYQDLLVESTPLERWAEFAIDCTLPGIFAGIIIQHYDAELGTKHGSRVYNHEGLQSAVQAGDIDYEEMLDFVLRAYAVTDDQAHDWSDVTGMRLYQEKIEQQFEKLWDRVLEPPMDPTRKWVGFLLDREPDHRSPMRSLRDIDEQIPIYPRFTSSELVNLFSRS